MREWPDMTLLVPGEAAEPARRIGEGVGGERQSLLAAPRLSSREAERRRRRPPASAPRPRSMPHLHQAVRTGTAEGLGACEQGAAAGEGRERRGGAADECAAGWCEAARPVRAASERTGCTRRDEYIVLDVQDAAGVAATAGDRVLLAAAAALNELAPVIFGCSARVSNGTGTPGARIASSRTLRTAIVCSARRSGAI